MMHGKQVDDLYPELPLKSFSLCEYGNNTRRCANFRSPEYKHRFVFCV